MTMSISSAPASTASRVSASLMSSAARPLGKAVATAATCTPRVAEASPWRSRPCRGRRRPRRPAGQVGSAGSGRIALAASARTLPGVSGALERGQVDHPDRQVDGLGLGGGLDRPGAQRGGARLARRPGRRPGGRAGSGAGRRRSSWSAANIAGIGAPAGPALALRQKWLSRCQHKVPRAQRGNQSPAAFRTSDMRASSRPAAEMRAASTPSVGRDRHDDLEVALDLGLGAAGPHDHPRALGEGVAQAVGGREVRGALGEVLHLRHREAAQGAGRGGARAGPWRRRCSSRSVNRTESWSVACSPYSAAMSSSRSSGCGPRPSPRRPARHSSSSAETPSLSRTCSGSTQ